MSIVTSLNNYLVSQEPKQRVLLYLVLIVVIGAIGYFLLFSDMFIEYEEKQIEVSQKETKLKTLQRSPKFAKIKVLQKEVKAKEASIAKTKEVITYKNNQLQNRPEIFVNDSRFANLLEDMMIKSRSLKVTIDDVTINTEELPYVGLLEIKRQMEISGYGKFGKILSLMRYVENQDMLFKLQSLNLQEDANKSLLFRANFDVAGLL